MAKYNSVLKNQRILIIEPHEGARLQMKLHFEKQGAVVYSTGRVEKIKYMIESSIFTDELFDIILIDVRLANCFGFYALSVMTDALRGRRAAIFVMSSGFGKMAIEQLVKWRVLGYLEKPFHIQDLDLFLTDRMTFFADRISEKKNLNKELQANDRPKLKAA